MNNEFWSFQSCTNREFDAPIQGCLGVLPKSSAQLYYNVLQLLCNKVFHRLLRFHSGPCHPAYKTNLEFKTSWIRVQRGIMINIHVFLSLKCGWKQFNLLPLNLLKRNHEVQWRSIHDHTHQKHFILWCLTAVTPRVVMNHPHHSYK